MLRKLDGERIYIGKKTGEVGGIPNSMHIKCGNTFIIQMEKK
jgi:hypothetical protein